MTNTAVSTDTQIISGQLSWRALLRLCTCEKLSSQLVRQVLLRLSTYKTYHTNCHGGHCCIYIHTTNIRSITMAGTAVSMYIQLLSGQLPWRTLCLHTYKQSQAYCHGGHCCVCIHTNNIGPVAMEGTAVSMYIQTVSGQLLWRALLYLCAYK